MKTLLVGYRAADLFEKGRRGKLRTAPFALEEGVVCHVLDIYHRHAIEKTHHLKTICSAHLPEGPWDLIRYKTGPKLMSGELALDLLQEIHLARPAKFVLDYVGKERDRNSLLDKIRDNPGKVRDFRAKWPASVPGLEPLEFTSVPGCFCHRRCDAGGLALAETVAAQTAGRGGASVSMLDMGCGCGLVGFLAAAAMRKATGSLPSLVMVDSHARAVEAAQMNSAAFGIPAEIILADNGTPPRLDGTFDFFAGNPPYYSDYRIAEVFLETARRALKPGGTCWTVVKNAANLAGLQEKYFGNVEATARRGYAVLRSVKDGAAFSRNTTT